MYTITLTKEEMIECAEALHNQGLHFFKQRDTDASLLERSLEDARIADKFIRTMHMVYIYEEELRREANSD